MCCFCFFLVFIHVFFLKIIVCILKMFFLLSLFLGASPDRCLLRSTIPGNLVTFESATEENKVTKHITFVTFKVLRVQAPEKVFWFCLGQSHHILRPS